jgi:hypothetical protein
MSSFPSTLLTLLLAVCVAVFVRFQDADFLLYIMPFKEANNGVGQHFTKDVVWITGASSGIGKSLAFDMMREGAIVVISARNATALTEVAAECKTLHGRAPVTLPLDVTDKAAVEQVGERISAAASAVLIGYCSAFTQAPTFSPSCLTTQGGRHDDNTTKHLKPRINYSHTFIARFT